MWVANHEKRGKIACRVSRGAFCIKNSIFLWFWTVYINIKNPDHHYLLYPMVKVLFFTDKAKYSRKLLFFNLFLDHHCLLYPMLQAVFFTDEAKYSRKLHFFIFFLVTIVSSILWYRLYFSQMKLNILENYIFYLSPLSPVYVCVGVCVGVCMCNLLYIYFQSFLEYSKMKNIVCFWFSYFSNVMACMQIWDIGSHTLLRTNIYFMLYLKIKAYNHMS